MAVPKVNRRRHADLSFRKVIFVVVAAFFAASVVVVELQPSNSSKSGLVRQKADTAANLLEVVVLRDEQLFLKSVKSCLPSEGDKCKTYVPESIPGASKKVQRVAILSTSHLSPPHVEHLTFASQDEPDLDVITRSSVPPYGYGKTHGLTKIVRWQHLPLVLEASYALHSALEPGQSAQTITLEDLKAAVRQVLRFHCRLSHVSAHTAVLSVRRVTAGDPTEAVTQLKSFVAPSGASTELEALIQRVVKEEQRSYRAKERFGSQLLGNLQTTSGVDVLQVLNSVLLDEVNQTKGFSTWPCLSFWTVGEEPNPLEISPMVQRIARALSPDCNDSLSNCWVGRDKCEARGDGACRDA